MTLEPDKIGDRGPSGTPSPPAASDGVPATLRRTARARFGKIGLSHFSLVSKLAAMLLLTGLISAALVAGIGYFNGREQISEQAVAQLESIKGSKRQQVEWYFRQMRETFKTFGEDVTVISAMAAFKDGYSQLGRQKPADERRARLMDYYAKEFLPKLAGETNVPSLQALMPGTDRALELQMLYIAENPNPASERGNLIDHPVSNAYTLAHYTYHPWFRDLIGRFKFYDLFLIDGETGDIIYTVEKEPDLGTNLIDGPYASSSLGRLAQAVMKSRQRGTAQLIDLSFYQPSGNAPAMFIATPIYSNWKFLGVLAAQVSTSALAEFMTNDRGWQMDGLGKTGEIYLAGEDRLMRSDARGMLEDKTGFLASPATTALPEATRKRMAAFDTTILLQPVDTESVRQALQGRAGTAEFIDFQGQEVLGSFAPLDIPDLNWILVVKRSTAELFAGLDTFARRVMIATLLLALAIPLLATLLARQFLKPLNALLAGIERLRAGEKEVAVAAHGSDEFSELTSAFNTMASTIRERDETIQAKSSAYEALLKHIFPDVVAERLKYGEGQMFESIPQTTVAFVSIYGFVQAMQDSDGDGERSFKLLNEIVDAFDSIAEENGVEKVKTIGEHYLAACGLSIPRLDHAQRMIEFADEIAAELERVNYAHGLSLSLRIGVDSGLVHAGLVGNRRFVYDIWGRPPNVARRMVSEASLNEIRLSEATFQELGSPADFEAREPFQSTTLGSVQTYGRTLATASGQKSKRSQTTDPKAAE